MSHDDALVPQAADHLSSVQRSNVTPIRAVPTVAGGRLQPNDAAGHLMLGTEHWATLRTQCEMLVNDRALHSSIDTAGKAMVIGLKAIEMGVPLTSAWSGMRIIDGEVTVLGKLALRLIQQRAIPMGAICKRIPVPHAEQGKRAGWLMKRPEGAEPVEYWFTIEDAKQAGLLQMYSSKKKAWIETPAYKKYPDRMLAWRALAKGAAYEFADILQGCLLAEEMSHKDPEFVIEQERMDEPSATSSSAPTFHTGAPARSEIGRDHELVRAASDLVNAYAELYVELYPECPEGKHTTLMSWYKAVVREKWQDLSERCVRGKCPTAEEATMMQSILRTEIKGLRTELENQALTSAAEKAQAEHEQGQSKPADDQG